LVGVAVALFASAAQAITVTTTVDTETQTVMVDFTELPPYVQIRLEGAHALFWCNCLDLDNPSSMLSTGFTVNGENLEMQYEGPAPPSSNFIDYHYLDGFVLSGFEEVEWVKLTLANEDELVLWADRPLLVPIPEPSVGLLCFAGLIMMSARTQAASRRTNACKFNRYGMVRTPRT